MESLVWIVGCVAASLVVGMVQDRRARRRRAAALDGEAVTCPAWLSLGTGRRRRGRLTVSPTQLVWRPLVGGRLIDLGGSTVVASALSAWNTAQPGDVVLRLAVPEVGSARLQLWAEDAATVVRDRRTTVPSPAASGPAAGRPPRTWWAVLCLVLAAAWALLFTASALSGYAATATVRGGDGEGFCTVTWDEGPGRSGTGEVGCSDQPAGTSLSIRVFMWPDENDPWDVPSAVFAALMVSVPLTVVGVWRLLYVRSRRPAVLPVTSPAHLTVPAALDDESWQRADEPLAAFLARLAPYARQQVPADGWEHPARPDGATRVVTLRRLGAALAGPAVLLTCVLSATAAPTYRWGVLGNGATGTTVATSTGETPVEGWGPFPREITVRFVDADGVEHLAEVVSDRDRPAGDEVAVEYSVGHPGQARLVDAGVLDGSVLLAASGLGIALLWLVWNGVRLMRRFHAVRSAEEAPGRPALGLLTADMLGKPLVLACDPLVSPVRFVAVPLLDPLPHGTAAAFATDAATSVTVCDGPPDGPIAVVKLPGGPTLLPSGPAFLPDAERVVDLLDSVSALAREVEEAERTPTPG